MKSAGLKRKLSNVQNYRLYLTIFLNFLLNILYVGEIRFRKKISPFAKTNEGLIWVLTKRVLFEKGQVSRKETGQWCGNGHRSECNARVFRKTATYFIFQNGLRRKGPSGGTGNWTPLIWAGDEKVACHLGRTSFRLTNMAGRTRALQSPHGTTTMT